MNENRNTEIRVGVVSIVAIVLLVIGIMLGKGVSFSPNKSVVKIRMTSSGGLETGSPVVVNGVKRGKVVNVMNSDGSVLAFAEIDDIEDIMSDASAIVTILEITGGKKVEITPGNSGNRFNVNNELPCRATSDLSSLIAQLGDVSGDLVMMIRRLDTLAASGTTLLADGTVVEDLKVMSHQGALLVTDARIWLAENGGNLSASVKDLRALVSDLRSAVNKNEPIVNDVLKKLERTLAEVDGMLAKADRAVVNADTLLTRVNGVISDIRTNRGTLNAVLYDEKFRSRLDSTIHGLRLLLDNGNKHGLNVNVGLGHRP